MSDVMFAAYPVFRAVPEKLERLDREVVTKEVVALLEEWSGRVTTRGTYSTAAFRADADLMMWWVADAAESVQDLQTALRRTSLGRALVPVYSFLGVVRPAEFAPDHVPAFVEGADPKTYLSVYPFVRTPEWYLLDPEVRAKHLRAHGELGRDYPDVAPNTTSAFGLGDHEWILAFEADRLDRLVDLIRHLRANESRLYVKEETPFVTGIRKPVAEAIGDLAW